MRRACAVLLAALVALGLLSAPAAAGPPARARAKHPLVVTGYALPGLKASVLRRDRHALDIVGADGLSVKADGSGVTSSNAALRRLKRLAHRRGLRAELLVNNYAGSLGDFDPVRVSRLLGSKAHRGAAVRRLVRTVRREKWDGVTVDLEAMRRRDRDGLVAFVRELRAALPRRVELSMDLGARTSIRQYRDAGFDLRRLARHVDRMVLMTYDQHGPGWSGPGPIGAIPWQRRTMKVLLGRVPRARVDLGIAGYGYTWPTSGTGHTVSPRRARAMVEADGATAVWHPKIGEWSTDLSDGTVMWWSDARSYRRRLAVARDLRVHGVALWVLGTADPLP